MATSLRHPPRGFLLAWDSFFAALAIASIAFVILHDQEKDGQPLLTEDARQAIVLVDYVLVALFLLDFAWEAYRAADRGRYLRRNWWTLLGMIPIGLGGWSALRFLRILRLVRLLRAFRNMARLLKTFQEALEGAHVLRLGLTSLSIMVAGSLLVWLFERGDNPALASYWEALWWSVVTVTTVGYGDITPMTAIGRVIAAILMVTGIGTIGLLAAQVSSHMMGAEPAKAGPAAELESLARLHAAGHLTDEEFSRAKAKVLA